MHPPPDLESYIYLPQQYPQKPDLNALPAEAFPEYTSLTIRAPFLCILLVIMLNPQIKYHIVLNMTICFFLTWIKVGMLFSFFYMLRKGLLSKLRIRVDIFVVEDVFEL